MNKIPKIRLYNTFKGKKEVLNTIISNKVTLYVCGPTLYDELHIGNARPLVVFDVLFRVLKFLYNEVIYVRNITDIDDKIINKAQILGISTKEVVVSLSVKYKNILSCLNILSPTYEPYASSHITDMIQIINLLISKGYAYIKDEHVFFNIAKHKEYGTLSKRSQYNTIMGLGNDSIVKNIKNNHKDFVLWKPSKPQEPVWDAPFGKGRPGWHIECSAMSYKFLGERFDIHGGGSDLLFPHHENERAQTMAAYDCSNTASIWMHNAFVNMNNCKMSKRLGNVINITDILSIFHGEVLRLSILLTHYRHPINFTKNSLTIAESILNKMYKALKLVSNIHEYDNHLNLSGEILLNEELENVKQAFLHALLDDLNTPLAIKEMQNIVIQINKSNDKKLQQELAHLLLYCANLLGILQIKPVKWFTNNISLSEEYIENLIKKRLEAKIHKNYTLADSIRDELLKKGIILEDNKYTTTWRRV